MKLTKEIESKLRSFDWKYIDGIHKNVFIIRNPKDMGPLKITVLNERRICFWTEEGGDYALCIPLCDILIFQ